MNKAIVTAIAIAPIFISSLIQTSLAMPGPEISVEPSCLNVSPGEEFTVNITVDPKDTEISGAQYSLSFNNTLLNATSLMKGTFFSGASTSPFGEGINNTIGMIDYGEAIIGGEGVTNPGTLTTITFKAIEPGTSSLSLGVILSNPYGYEITDVSANDGACDIVTTTPTPSPTPTSGGGDNGNGDASVTPTPTSTPLSSGEDNRNSNGEEPVTPMQTPTINPVPSQSTSPSPTITISPIPTASMSSPTSEEHNRLQGFEVALAIVGLLAMSYLLKRKR